MRSFPLQSILMQIFSDVKLLLSNWSYRDVNFSFQVVWSVCGVIKPNELDRNATRWILNHFSLPEETGERESDLGQIKLSFYNTNNHFTWTSLI